MKTLMFVFFIALVFVITAGADATANRYYNDMVQARKQRDELLTLMTEQENQRDWMVAQRDSAVAQVGDLQNRVTSIQTELDTARQAGEEQAGRIAQLEIDLLAKQNELAIVTENLKSFQATATEKDQQITDLKDDILEKNRTIAELQARVGGVENDGTDRIEPTGNPPLWRYVQSLVIVTLAVFFLAGGAALASRRGSTP